MSQAQQPTAEQAYLAAHDKARDLLSKIEDQLFQLGPPGDEEFPIGWDDVATVNEVVNRLREVAYFLDPNE